MLGAADGTLMAWRVPRAMRANVDRARLQMHLAPSADDYWRARPVGMTVAPVSDAARGVGERRLSDAAIGAAQRWEDKAHAHRHSRAAEDAAADVPVEGALLGEPQAAE